MVWGDADEHFLDDGYSKQNSKNLHSYHKKLMPNSFSGTFLIGKKFSMNLALCKLIFQKYIYSYRVLLIEWRILIDTWVESIFYLSIFLKILLKLLKVFKIVVDLFNENLVKNIDGLLAKRTVDQDIERVGKEKKDSRIIATRCLTDFFQFVNRLWTFHLKFWLLYSLTWHLIILWKLLLSVKYFITYQGKINYLLRKFVILGNCIIMINVFTLAIVMCVFHFLINCLFI